MKKSLLILIFAVSLLGGTSTFASSCEDAYSSAEEAYSYARRGWRSDDIDDIQYYARKAKNAAEEAIYYADDCGCYEASSYADDAYTQARRAYNEDDFDWAEDYIRWAMNYAEDAMFAADYCY